MTVTTTPVWKLSLEAAAEGAVECGHLQSLHDLRLKGSRKFWICALSGPHGCRVNAEVTSYCALWSVSCSHRPGGLWVVAGIVLRGSTPLGVGRAPRLGPSKPLGPQWPMRGPQRKQRKRHEKMRPSDTKVEQFYARTLRHTRRAPVKMRRTSIVTIAERPWPHRKDLTMGRVSKQTRASAIFVAAAAALGAMTVYNVNRARKAESEHPPKGQFVTVDGVRLHYLEKGEGPPVVLLHGNLVTAEDFGTSGVLALLAKRHRVIAFDRPGFGYSDRPHGSAWSARAQADLLRDALITLGINRPVVLGHSWGAAVALALALNHPTAARGLVLLSGYYYPTFRADVLLSSPPAIPLLGDLLRYSISPLLGRLMQPLLLKGMFAPLPVPTRFAKGSTSEMSVRPGQIRAENSRRCRNDPWRLCNATPLSGIDDASYHYGRHQGSRCQCRATGPASRANSAQCFVDGSGRWTHAPLRRARRGR